MKKKRTLSVAAALGIVGLTVLMVTVGVTVSYLFRQEEKKNQIVVGHGDEEISEQFSEPSELRMQSSVDKEFVVKNTGTVPTFVRLYAAFSDSTVADKASVTFNGETYTWTEFLTKMEDPAANNITTDWVYLKEDSTNGKLGGYFYYTKALPVPDGTNAEACMTAPLFTNISVDFRDDLTDDEDSNIDKISAFDMIVYSESVQTTETGAKTVQVTDNTVDPPVTEDSTVYGYVYSDAEWQDAWRSFLKISA